MVTKAKSARDGCVLVRFELPACLWADQIFVVGEFTQWERHSLPMTQDRSGVWSLAIDLPTGYTYEFRYLVDNRWLTDGHADGVVTNTFGTQNSIVHAKLPLEIISERPDCVLA